MGSLCGEPLWGAFVRYDVHWSGQTHSTPENSCSQRGISTAFAAARSRFASASVGSKQYKPSRMHDDSISSQMRTSGVSAVTTMSASASVLNVMMFSDAAAQHMRRMWQSVPGSCFSPSPSAHAQLSHLVYPSIFAYRPNSPCSYACLRFLDAAFRVFP